MTAYLNQLRAACFIQVEMQHYSTRLIQFIEFMTDLTDILYLLVTLSHFPQSMLRLGKLKYDIILLSKRKNQFIGLYSN